MKMKKRSADYAYPFSIYHGLAGKSINLLTLTEQEKKGLVYDLAKRLKELKAVNNL